ncbi:MAG: lipid A biosynthesis acyltransferase, partial [Bacteroidota bacterium]
IFASRKAFLSIFRFFHSILKFNFWKSLISIYINYYNFGQVLIDKIAMLAGFQSNFTFDFEGEEYLRQMDNGGFLISAHVGNWEIAGQLLNRLDKKINIILFDAEHQQIKGYLSNVLTNRNVNFIVIRDNYSHLLEIKQALANKEIIAMHGDRFIEGNRTTVADLLGKPALFPIGPVNMASRFNVPVSFVFAVKETRKHYHFYATPLLNIPFSRNLRQRDQSLTHAIKVYAGKLEAILIHYPLQWFNYYDFWKLPESSLFLHETVI